MLHARQTSRYARSIGIRLTAALLDRAHRAAVAREQRLSELCRDALREHLDRIERGGKGSAR